MYVLTPRSPFTLLTIQPYSCPSLVRKRARGQVSDPSIPAVIVPEAYSQVVTGATDGIGREFASQLAKAGFNLLIASRNAEKLNVVGAELGRCHSMGFFEAVC